jgi:hypothetical protein
MPRKLRKPFFKASHQAWYVSVDGRQIRLGETEVEAIERYGEILKERKKVARFIDPSAPKESPSGEVQAGGAC